MKPFTRLHQSICEENMVCNKQLFELIDYLFSLEENNFSGQLEINFRRGTVNQIAFNQKAVECLDLSAN